MLDSFSGKRAGKIWQTRIEELRRETLKIAPTRRKELFGLSDEAEDVFRALVGADDPFDRESVELVSDEVGVDASAVQRRVDWGERLGLLSRVGEGAWTMNPLVRRLLDQPGAPEMNDLWTLPGAARFLRRVERYLRDGVSAVVRFPGEAPDGFREGVLSALDGSWRCDIFRPDAAEPPFEGLRQRFAPQMSSAWKPTLLDLCEHEEFHGRLVWLDGLDALDRDDWLNWKRFLTDYAQASRSVQEFERTLFVAVLEGSPPEEAPPNDVTLVTCDWRDVIDEMDLLFLAHEHLRQRNMRPAMRSLLATTVARVAVWDVDVAVRLLDEGEGVILAPCSMLRSVADEKGWKTDTPVGLGVRHSVGQRNAACRTRVSRGSTP